MIPAETITAVYIALLFYSSLIIEWEYLNIFVPTRGIYYNGTGEIGCASTGGLPVKILRTNRNDAAE
jgi:hypothetical protein